MQVVNGYVCQNCTDVANAKMGVDPAHPKDPPKSAESTPAERGPAVTFGGQLKPSDPVRESSAAPFTPGYRVDVFA
jgi:hypothetical protein